MKFENLFINIFTGSFRLLILSSIIGFVISLSLLFRNELSKSIQVLQINNQTGLKFIYLFHLYYLFTF